ncbi:MAG TPA: InlB B-repeat-containing protein [Clostridia bacterium]
MIYKRFYLIIISVFIFLSACSSGHNVRICLISCPNNFSVLTKKQLIELPEPQKDGFIFEGWYFDKNFQNPLTQDSLRKLNKNVTLYPKWKPIVYKIKYNLNGGQALGELIEQYTILSNEIVLPKAEKRGFKFLGWADEKGEFRENINPKELRDFELSAVWSQRRLIKIEIANQPDKLEYLIGQKLDLTGLKIKAEFDNGEAEIIDIQEALVEGYDCLTAGQQTLTVIYNYDGEEFYCRFDIIVIGDDQDIGIGDDEGDKTEGDGDEINDETDEIGIGDNNTGEIEDDKQDEENDAALRNVFEFLELDNEVWITGVKSGIYGNSLTIPAQYNNKPITKVLSYAFSFLLELNEIYVEPRNALLTVSADAFFMFHQVDFYIKCGAQYFALEGDLGFLFYNIYYL